MLKIITKKLEFDKKIKQKEFSERLFAMADHYVFNDRDYMVAHMYPKPSPYKKRFIEKYEGLTEEPKKI